MQSVSRVTVTFASFWVILVMGVSIPQVSHAGPGGRPADLALEDFQFGPANRWTFSHMREVLPTVNIPRDPSRFLLLQKSDEFVSDFSVSFQDRDQAIDAIAVHQYIDGLLVLKDGAIVFESP